MNVFIIPSWYPSVSHPNEGVYYKHQAESFARNCQDSNFGISTWGQSEPRYLIEAKDNFKNLIKIANKNDFKESEKELRNNLYEYFKPTFTWTRKILNGNIAEIVKANLSNLLKFERRFGKVDVIHAHVAHPGGYVAMKLSEIVKVPFLITEHMGPFPFQSYLNSDKSLSRFIKEPLFKSSMNIAVSPPLVETMNSYGIPRVSFVPNFVDEEIFYPSCKGQNERFTFLTCGGVVYDKGIYHLIKAVEELKSKNLQIRFRIAGKGKDLQHFKKMTEDLGLSEYITFLGEIQRIDIVEVIQQCDAFILPSLHENLPIAILEALACGKPVISTKCGGPEYMINQDNGLIVPPGNIAALSDSMVQMHREHQKYSAEVIRKNFIERYSCEKVLGEIMRIYEDLAKRRIS